MTPDERAEIRARHREDERCAGNWHGAKDRCPYEAGDEIHFTHPGPLSLPGLESIRHPYERLGLGWCQFCTGNWPCEASSLLAEIDRLEAALWPKGDPDFPTIGLVRNTLDAAKAAIDRGFSGAAVSFIERLEADLSGHIHIAAGDGCAESPVEPPAR